MGATPFRYPASTSLVTACIIEVEWSPNVCVMNRGLDERAVSQIIAALLLIA